MTSETMFAQSPSIGFKCEIGCTIPKNRSKSDVSLASKVLEVPTSLEINFSTIKVGLYCSFYPEKTRLYHSLLGKISYRTEKDETHQLNTD